MFCTRGVALVDGLRDATFNDQAFAQLVLPRARKRLIEALVLSHADEGRAKVDLIAGKGEGSIFLLHGRSRDSNHAVSVHARSCLIVYMRARVGYRPARRGQDADGGGDRRAAAQAAVHRAAT